jgi:hypothetical protein
MAEDALKLFAVLLGDGALLAFGIWQVAKMRRLRREREAARQQETDRERES